VHISLPTGVTLNQRFHSTFAQGIAKLLTKLTGYLGATMFAFRFISIRNQTTVSSFGSRCLARSEKKTSLGMWMRNCAAKSLRIFGYARIVRLFQYLPSMVLRFQTDRLYVGLFSICLGQANFDVLVRRGELREFFCSMALAHHANHSIMAWVLRDLSLCWHEE
jgi:hypothetical protein